MKSAVTLITSAWIMLCTMAPSFAANAEAVRIEDFARQVFVQGVPYETASQYPPSAVPVLLEMLNDPREQAYWANIAVILQIIGDDTVFDPVVEFIEKQVSDNYSADHYTAITSAIMAMGYLVHHTGNRAALRYLQQSMDPQVWISRNIHHAGPFFQDTTETYMNLSLFAMLGLALSGHPEVVDSLRAVEKAGDTPLVETFRNRYLDTAKEALQAHDVIAREGLAGYYTLTK